MAFPFGGLPTLGSYIEWAVQQGCTVRCGVVLDERQRPHSVTQIFSPDGKRWVSEIGVQNSDYLVATTVGRLDRRLGLTSPFFAIDDPAMDD